jgi:TRAP-type C4-dicarboxylate transport system substrate-binding protein
MSVASTALALFCLAVRPSAAATQMVSLVYNGSPQSPQQIGSDEFRRKLAEIAQGRIILDERAGNAMGSETALLAAMRSGVVDMATLSGSVVSSAVPEFGVFDVPFLFRRHFADKGLVLLAIGKQGFRNVTNSKRPIRSPADLQGLKIRVLPNEVYQMTFKALGAEVVPMEFTLVYSALKDGRIDGQENPVATIAASHLEEVQKYASLTGHFFAPIAFVANRDVFQALAPADQAAIIAAAKAGAEATWKSGVAEETKKIEELRRGGMEITEKVDRQPFIDAVKPLEPEFEKRFGKDLLARIRATP